jgi:hypothetical protein
MQLSKIHLLAAVLFVSGPAQATTIYPQKFVCPVGGQKFRADVIGSMTSWGQRPDGRRYGTTPIVPLTECPGNGFIFFDDKFEPDEVAKLTPLVLSPEYQAMRKSDTPRFRAWWLMDHLGRDPFDLTFALLGATWEADGEPGKKSRYQRMLVDAAAKLPWAEDKRSNWFWLNLRAANALRELGEFDKSQDRLAALDSPSRLPTDADELQGARMLIDGLKALNSERNAALEPANLIPPMEAGLRCQSAELTPTEVKACAGPEIQKAVETLKDATPSD